MKDNKSIVVLFDVREDTDNQNESGQLNLLNGSMNKMLNESKKDVISLTSKETKKQF